MNNRIIACISFLILLTAIILTNINEIQNNGYVGAGAQVQDQIEEDEAITLFKYIPSNGRP